MTHLGDRLTAFVDGELPHDAREYVLGHLAGCAECRTEAEAERAIKARLAALDGLRPPDGLLRRLHALAEPGEPLPPRRTPIDTSPRPPAVPVSVWQVPGSPMSGGRAGVRSPVVRQLVRGHGRLPAAGRRRQRLHAVAAGVSVAAMALGAAVAIGGQSQPGPAVGPADDWFAVEHASTTGGLPLVDPAMSMTIGFGSATGMSIGTATGPVNRATNPVNRTVSGASTGTSSGGSAYFGVSQR